jgi:DNA-directed RNA polymerase specialized sigma24 family protein
MQEDSELRRCYPASLSVRQAAPPWEPSAIDAQRTSEALSSAFGGLPSERQIANALSIDLTEERLALRDVENLESGDVITDDTPEKDGAQIEPSSDDLQEGPCFSSTLTVREEALAINSSEWTISAPAIERAIRTLYVKYGRAPTDIEIAEELRIDIQLYWETLSHLKNLEIGVLYAAHDPASEDEWLAYGADRGEGDVLFRCLRSEMQALLRNAIHSLPAMERLVITLTYHEFLGDKDISVILQSSEPAVSNIRKSATLDLRASLPNPEIYRYRRVRRMPSRPGEIDTSKLAQASTAQACYPNGADVRVGGGQKGSLARQPWDYLGDSATWERSFTSWYLFDDEEKLTQIERVEHYRLDCEL